MNVDDSFRTFRGVEGPHTKCLAVIDNRDEARPGVSARTPTSRRLIETSSGSRIPQMGESDLLKCVLSLAKLYGWRSFHARPAMTAKGYRTAVQGDGKGFPDLILTKPGTGIFAVELKSDKGSTTPAQREWLDWFYRSGAHIAVWKPSDWADGSILRTLSGTKKENQ